MVHESASSGYRRRAATYHEARPGYHPRLVERFADRYAHELVVDVGAGTGIFTAQIAKAGARVVAVEPVDAMRDVLAAALPNVEVCSGTAEALPVEAGGADTVVAAQAFHWFAFDEALDEAHRVLRPRGHLVTVWNVRDKNADWVADYDRILGRYEGATPRHASMAWRKAIDADGRFELVDDWGVANPQQTTVEGVVGRALSTSFIAALDASEQAHVADQLRALLTPLGPELTFPYRSELQAWRRL